MRCLSGGARRTRTARQARGAWAPVRATALHGVRASRTSSSRKPRVSQPMVFSFVLLLLLLFLLLPPPPRGAGAQVSTVTRGSPTAAAIWGSAATGTSDLELHGPQVSA
ncbi:unnamed protein product [Prorocentrum cordatum]|uniref:Subtilisin n=1 Tax=Prorocentrum cordatum TaxID=2364126 RepID=A0ABN9RDI5_9DINO|nr:unnamed protein product [Polarella glacialis]